MNGLMDGQMDECVWLETGRWIMKLAVLQVFVELPEIRASWTATVHRSITERVMQLVNELKTIQGFKLETETTVSHSNVMPLTLQISCHQNRQVRNLASLSHRSMSSYMKCPPQLKCPVARGTRAVQCVAYDTHNTTVNVQCVSSVAWHPCSSCGTASNS